MPKNNPQITAASSNSAPGKKSLKAEELKGRLLLSCILILVTVLAYIPAVQSGFIWDDDSYVTDNMALRTLRGLRLMWTTPESIPQYYPLVHTALWIQYHLWQLNPVGYHLVNVAFHLISAFLLWLILTKLDIPGAFLAAAVFALHPVHVESVAWITELKNVLSLLFYLLAFLAYLKFSPPQQSLPAPAKYRLGFHGLSLFFFLCALLSKTVTCSFPVAVLIVYWWKRGKIILADVLAVLPFLILGAAAGLFTGWMEKNLVGAAGHEWQFTFIERCLIAGRAWWFYIAKLLFPYKLVFTYPRWEIDAAALSQYLFPAGALVFVYLLWRYRYRIGRGPLAGILFFSVSVFPALGFFDVYPMRFSFVADHFQYLASLGIIVLFSAGAAGFFEKKARDNEWLGYGFGTVLILVLAGLTFSQGWTYKDKITLYSDIIRKNPSSWMAYNNRGVLYLRQRKIEEAFADFNRAIELKEDYIEAYDNRGMIYLQRKKYDLALADFNKAISLQPRRSFQAYGDRGMLYFQQGRYSEAIADFDQALKINRYYVLGYVRRGVAYVKQRQYPLALGDFNQALKINPRSVDGRVNRGILYTELGRYDQAMADYNLVLRSSPRYCLAYYNRGVTYERKKMYREALKDAVRAKALGCGVKDAYIDKLKDYVSGTRPPLQGQEKQP